MPPPQKILPHCTTVADIMVTFLCSFCLETPLFSFVLLYTMYFCTLAILVCNNMIFLTKKPLRGKRKSVSYHAIYGKIILQLDLQAREVSEQLSLLLWGNRNTTILGPGANLFVRSLIIKTAGKYWKLPPSKNQKTEKR